MIVTKDLSKNFNDFVAVGSVNLEVAAGEVLGLLGPNGAGKTTTVRMLTSILKPSSGWAKVAGFDIVKQAKEVRASVGVLTEHHGLYNRMPAGDYLNFFGQLYKIKPPDLPKRINEILDQFGLLGNINKPIGEFSKGMRQKLALARALIHNPLVLLLDEPTSAMDPESARLVRDEIHQLRSKERAIVICTHNLAEAEELADKIAIIRKGRIIAQGTPTTLKKLFLGSEEYTLHFTECFKDHTFYLPEGAALVNKGADWIQYQAKDPRVVNPLVLDYFMRQGKQVLSLQENKRNLEQVYMQVINSKEEKTRGNAR